MTYRVPTIVAGSSGSGSSGLAISKPSALRVGDLVVLVVTSEGSGMSVASDWIPIVDETNQGLISFRAWYKFATNAESSYYSVVFDTAGDSLYNLFIVRGADPFSVVDVYDQAAGNSTLPIAQTGVTTTVDNCLAIAVIAFDGSPRVLSVHGWTALESQDGDPGTIAQAVASKTIATAGASGGASWTASDSSAGDYVTLTLAVRPGPMSLANSVILEPQDLLAKTLADCDEFRNLVGASSHSAAQASIWHESLPRPASGRDNYALGELSSYRPFALIFTNDLDGAMATRQASAPGAWSERGALRILIEFDTPDSLKNSPVLLDQLMKQIVGRICKRPTDEAETFDGLWDLAHRTNEDDGYSYLAIDQVNFRGYHRSAEQDQPGQGDFLFAWIEVLYGQRG